jgi:hypothetical protein
MSWDASGRVGVHREETAGMAKKLALDKVFVAGGLPTHTYVSRDHLGLERQLKRAIAKPHSFASVTGTSKSGKTVLCRSMLGDRQFVWLESGQIGSIEEFWTRLAAELQTPEEITETKKVSKGLDVSATGGGKIKIPLVAEGGASAALKTSVIRDKMVATKSRVNIKKACLDHLLKHNIILVIDDFHYIDRETQTKIIRALKGAVFDGVKVILLSVSYKAYEAIQAETEITGRFVHVDIPDWSEEDLAEIARKGCFKLDIDCANSLIGRFAAESNGSPQLMQQFCWEMCFIFDISETCDDTFSIPRKWDPVEVFDIVAKDAGQPIYEKLAAGPQSRSARDRRPLKTGGTVDIYEAILLAIAKTGPKQSLTYNELRTGLSGILEPASVPQKIEVSNALNHLAKISGKIAEDTRPIDWIEGDRTLVLADPMFRFYLKWRLVDGKKKVSR